MAQLTIQVNGRPYTVGCEDGQEAHLLEIARLFDRQVRQVSQDVGQLGETRLFLMGALLLADEVHDLKVELSQARAGQPTLDNPAMAERLVRVAERIEGIAAGLERP